MSLWKVALLVFLLNLPFGYWRASVRRLSWQWFPAVLLPLLLLYLPESLDFILSRRRADALAHRP